MTVARAPIESLAHPPLTPDAAIPAALEGRWWVAHTRARNEKALARDLDRLNIVNFLPLQQRASRSRRGGRWSWSTVPVFSGYLFFNATERQRCQALSTNRMANVLNVPNQEQFVAQIRNIYRMLISDATLEHFNGVRVGQWVRVMAGPLMGVEGCVMRRLGRTRLAVNVDILGQAVLAEVEAALLEPADPPDTAASRSNRRL